MRRVSSLAVLLWGLLGNSAFAHNFGKCDPSWNMCLSFNRSQPAGTYFAGTYFPTSASIQANKGLTIVNSGAQVALKPGTLDVVAVSPDGRPLLVIGQVNAPIGDDAGYAFARQFALAGNVTLAGRTEDKLEWYCDPGGVFGAVWYLNKMRYTYMLFKNQQSSAIVTAQSFLGVVKSRPAVFGCPKK